MQVTDARERSCSRLIHVCISPLLIFAVALAVRLIYLALLLWNRPPLHGAPLGFGYETGRIAQSIAAGRGYSSPLRVETGPTAWITPVYPYLLAGIFKIFGVATTRSEIAIRALNSLFSALVCFPLYGIGRRLFGAAVGAAAAWLWALNYTAVLFSTTWIWDTSLGALLMTVLLWTTYSLGESGSTNAWAGYGGLWALGALTNASLLSLLPGFLGYAAYNARRRSTSWLRRTVLALAVFGAGVSPWLIRNQLVFHRQVLFRSNFGLELWLGNNPEVPDSWSWWLHPTENEQEREKFRQMGEIAYMQEKQRLALDFIRTHPGDFARFSFHRFMNNWTGTWEPLADAWKTVGPWVRAGLAFDCLFSLLAFAGMLFARRALPNDSFPLLYLMLVFPLVFYITHSALRYRHPIDPAMALLAVLAVAHPLQTLATQRSGRENVVAQKGELATRR